MLTSIMKSNLFRQIHLHGTNLLKEALSEKLSKPPFVYAYISSLLAHAARLGGPSKRNKRLKQLSKIRMVLA